jgi:hypothetical protein
MTKPDNIELRDYFAAMALQGLLANYQIVKSEETRSKKYNEEFKPASICWFPESAYKYADEMIKTREYKL